MKLSGMFLNIVALIRSFSSFKNVPTATKGRLILFEAGSSV